MLELFGKEIVTILCSKNFKKTLLYLSVTVRDRLLTNQEAIMGSAKAVKFIMYFTNAKVEVILKLLSY